MNPADRLSICIWSFGKMPGGSSYLNPWSIGFTLNALPTLSDTGNNATELPVELVTPTVGSVRYPAPAFVIFILVTSLVLEFVCASITIWSLEPSSNNSIPFSTSSLSKRKPPLTTATSPARPLPSVGFVTDKASPTA